MLHKLLKLAVLCLPEDRTLPLTVSPAGPAGVACEKLPGGCC